MPIGWNLKNKVTQLTLICWFMNEFSPYATPNLSFPISMSKYAFIYTRSLLCPIHIIFVNFQQSCGPWSTWKKLSLCSISCELICGFRSNFVYALVWTRCSRFGWLKYIFVHFQQGYYGSWLMTKFRLCSISCESMDGFWYNLVNGLILTKSE